MRLKTMALGAGGLALLAVLTFALNARRNAPVAEGRVGKPLIQNLDMGKVARMTLTTESTVTLEKSADGAWVVAEQGRFIADEVKLRGLLLKLTEQ
ncbi:MAG: hypothetical protein OEW39_14285, partial [Deltaproteobacteria bacterium]|nr:hypothetical protein [Deltaproteobacteria bacterium]